jgi:Zn-dependent peptidase ImmA (M78 family)
MSLDLQMMSSKLRRFRSQVESSLSEVSSATGISEKFLEDYEQARRQPTGDEILILADYYKCDFKFFISNEKLAAFEQTETLFRKYSSELSKADRWAILELLFLCECEEYLLKALPSESRSMFAFEKKGSHFKTHGAEAAAALRLHMGYDARAVGMDIYRDFRSIGCHIFRRRLTNSTISGLCIRHPVAGKCILVNYSEDVYRQRFTAAHEVAHAILDDDQDVIVSFTSDKGNLSEIRANVFASKYLMPPELLRMIPSPNQWDQQKSVDWASKLKVSTQSLAYALKDAGLISEEQESEILAVKVPAAVKSDPELPMTLSPNVRQRREEFLSRGLSMSYVDLCFDAYDRGAISAGRLGEMLLAKEDELPGIAELYGRQLKHED